MNLFGIPHFDKVGHFGMYMIWTFLVYYASTAVGGNPSGKTFWKAVLVGAIIGVALEYGQKFMHQGRSFEAADMIANTLGALIGALGGVLWRKLKNN